jgi:hypothetical protein
MDITLGGDFVTEKTRMALVRRGGVKIEEGSLVGRLRPSVGMRAEDNCKKRTKVGCVLRSALLRQSKRDPSSLRFSG